MIERSKSSRIGEIKVQEYMGVVKTHQVFLKKFKVFPEKTRKATYKDLLALPLNYGHFQQLSKPYKILPEHGLNKQVAFITQSLTKLYPELNIQLLPSIIHPFVKLFQEDCLFAFECSLTFLLNWIFPILGDYPNPPKKVMEIFEKQLTKLNAKVNEFDYPLSAVINPMFVATLTDVINRKDWLEIFDFFATNPFKPELYLAVGLAIVKSVEDKLINLPSIEQISLGLRKEKNISMESVIQEALQLRVKYEGQFAEIYDSKKTMFPLTKGRYPVYKFIKSPINLVNKQIEETAHEDIRRIEQKFKKITKIMNKKLRDGKFSNDQEIEDNFKLVYTQIQQYLREIKEEHQNKIEAYKEIEGKFSKNLDGMKNARNMTKNLQAIDRQAKLSGQIQNLKVEADYIKAFEESMIEQMNGELHKRKFQLKETNKRLRQRI